MDNQTCTKCEETKPVSEFHYRKDRGKYRYHCKACCNLISRQYYQKRTEFRKKRFRERYADNTHNYKDTHNNSKMSRYYGITLEKRQEMLADQDGRCKICNIEESSLKKRLAVDHDHSTNEVRGLLCDRCNLGLGHFNDDPERLILAANYLQRRKA